MESCWSFSDARTISPWYASTPEDEWGLETDEERAELEARWDPLLGDRQTEIVFIGIDMDEDAIRSRLDSCVLTGREFEKGFKVVEIHGSLPEWDMSCDLDFD